MRNACAMSLITGQPFQITNIRGKRSKPGLMRQHVTAVEAACVIGNAECQGLSVGSSELTFRPGQIVPGDYHFAVGTAGSTGLVLQTVLMPLVLADKPSRLILEGGTHNMLAPPFDFIERSFLPIINRMGPSVSARLVRHGFYPRGGGRIEVEIVPAPLKPIDCLDRGELLGVSASALFAGLPFDIADREIQTARKLLGWPEEAFTVRQLPDAMGPGNALLLQADYAHVTEVVTGFGQLGVSAQKVAGTAASRMAGYQESGAFAGPYLQDQLVLPFALARGGSFTTVKPGGHFLSACEGVERFLGIKLAHERQADGVHRVCVV